MDHCAATREAMERASTLISSLDALQEHPIVGLMSLLLLAEMLHAVSGAAVKLKRQLQTRRLEAVLEAQDVSLLQCLGAGKV